jgi:hypothetical protein
MIWKAIEDLERGLYDDVDKIMDAVQYRLSRKVLPRFIDEGFIEYGLQIPYNYQTRAASSFSHKKSRNGTDALGPDVEWILRGSGSVSRGSAGSVTHNLGVNGASGQLYGSNVSLESSRNTDSSLKKGQRSSSLGTADSWNPHTPIPRIRETRADSQDSQGRVRHHSKSLSPPNSQYDSNSRRRTTSNEDETNIYYNHELDVDDVEGVIDDRILSPG